MRVLHIVQVFAVTKGFVVVVQGSHVLVICAWASATPSHGVEAMPHSNGGRKVMIAQHSQLLQPLCLCSFLLKEQLLLLLLLLLFCGSCSALGNDLIAFVSLLCFVNSSGV